MSNLIFIPKKTASPTYYHADLRGTNGDVFDRSGSALLSHNIAEGLISIWFRADTGTLGTNTWLFTAYDDSADNDDYINLRIRSDDKLQFYTRDTNIQHNEKSTTSIADDTEYHVVAASTDDGVRMWVNGSEETLVQQGTPDLTDTAAGVFLDHLTYATASKLVIGGDVDGNNTLNGQIGQVGIHSCTGLSTSQVDTLVATLWSSGSSIIETSETSCLNFWSFDGQDGTDDEAGDNLTKNGVIAYVTPDRFR